MRPAPKLRAGLEPLAGRYALQRRIAEGGMGEVWRGRDLLQDRDVAVKFLTHDHADSLERFRAEARHSAALTHAGIASVYDYGEQADGAGLSAWLVMELVDGPPLSDVLRRGRLHPARALEILGQTALALAAAHEAGLVHRDVKPGNLLVRPDGVVKVTDFGIAAALGSPGTQPGTMIGTAYYVSPEQALGHEATPASDIYSLGVVAYECLTGSRPFAGADAREIMAKHVGQPPPGLPADLPAGVHELVLGALAKDPADRPASAAGLGRAALALRTDLLRGPARRRVPGGPARHRAGVRLAGALLTVTAVAAVGRHVLTGDTVLVPPVPPGTSVGVAEARLRTAGLDPVRRPVDAQLTPGELVGTSPPGGTAVRRGSRVTVLLSSGPGGVPTIPSSP